MKEAPERKRNLASAAATLVSPGELVFLDSGSTNVALAAELASVAGITVVTNSCAIAAAMAGETGPQLVVIGGSVDRKVGGCIDAQAMLELQRFNVDRCFLGACSVSLSGGISAFDHADAVFKRVLVEVSNKVTILVTTEKLGTRAPHQVAALDQIDQLVLEADVPETSLASFRTANVELLVPKASP